ncbi:hypothetical protein Brsp04_04132 [Brucella sp. NBRC 12952]|jgi:hypothetical protein
MKAVRLGFVASPIPQSMPRNRRLLAHLTEGSIRQFRIEPIRLPDISQFVWD